MVKKPTQGSIFSYAALHSKFNAYWALPPDLPALTGCLEPFLLCFWDLPLICCNFSKKSQSPAMPKKTSNRLHRKSMHIRENTGPSTLGPGYSDFLEFGTRASPANTGMQSALQPPGMKSLRASACIHYPSSITQSWILIARNGAFICLPSPESQTMCTHNDVSDEVGDLCPEPISIHTQGFKEGAQIKGNSCILLQSPQGVSLSLGEPLFPKAHTVQQRNAVYPTGSEHVRVLCSMRGTSF